MSHDMRRFVPPTTKLYKMLQYYEEGQLSIPFYFWFLSDFIYDTRCIMHGIHAHNTINDKGHRRTSVSINFMINFCVWFPYWVECYWPFQVNIYEINIEDIFYHIKNLICIIKWLKILTLSSQFYNKNLRHLLIGWFSIQLSAYTSECIMSKEYRRT